MMSYQHISSVRRFGAPLSLAIAVGFCGPIVSPSHAQQGIAALYRQNQGVRGSNVDRYLFDRHFYHRPGVHPAMNLYRHDPPGSTAFHSFVRPEQERREQAMQTQRAYTDARRREGRVGEMRLPPSPARARGGAANTPATGQSGDRFQNTGGRFGTR